MNLDNTAKRKIRPALNRCAVCHEAQDVEHKGHTYVRDSSLPLWPGWYSFRRRLGTKAREASGSSDTASKALGNSRDVADRHYIKPDAVLADVRTAVEKAAVGLV